MSIRLMQAVMDAKTETPAEKLVLLIIANYADDDGSNVFPSKATIADKTGLDARTVQRICAKLVERKVLVVVQECPRRPTIYRLVVAALAPLETYRRAAGRPQKLPAPVQNPTGPSAKPTGDTPPHPSDNHQDEPIPSDSAHVGEPPAEPAPASDLGDLEPSPALVPSWAADWPVLHVENGDYVVREPYASDPRIREGMLEWIGGRLRDKKKGMPTVYSLTHKNCGWWDKYPLDAVAHAVQHSASESWQGIIEDVARKWKPSPGTQASVSSVRHSVQQMAQTMEDRQRMIREAGQRSNGQQALTQTGQGGNEHGTGISTATG